MSGLKSNLNKLLNSYGIELSEDALLRRRYKFLHPKKKKRREIESVSEISRKTSGAEERKKNE